MKEQEQQERLRSISADGSAEAAAAPAGGKPAAAEAEAEAEEEEEVVEARPATTTLLPSIGHCRRRSSPTLHCRRRPACSKIGLCSAERPSTMSASATE